MDKNKFNELDEVFKQRQADIDLRRKEIEELYQSKQITASEHDVMGLKVDIDALTLVYDEYAGVLEMYEGVMGSIEKLVSNAQQSGDPIVIKKAEEIKNDADVIIYNLGYLLNEALDKINGMTMHYEACNRNLLRENLDIQLPAAEVYRDHAVAVINYISEELSKKEMNSVVDEINEFYADSSDLGDE